MVVPPVLFKVTQPTLHITAVQSAHQQRDGRLSVDLASRHLLDGIDLDVA